MRHSLWILVPYALGLMGCRAAPGQACTKNQDCQTELRCHQKTCKTRKEIAQIRMKENEARWQSQKQGVFDKMKATQERIKTLQRQLKEADSEAKREAIERELDGLNPPGKPTASAPVGPTP
jgi:hypothetical protein